MYGSWSTRIISGVVGLAVGAGGVFAYHATTPASEAVTPQQESRVIVNPLVYQAGKGDAQYVALKHPMPQDIANIVEEELSLLNPQGIDLQEGVKAEVLSKGQDVPTIDIPLASHLSPQDMVVTAQELLPVLSQSALQNQNVNMVVFSFTAKLSDNTTIPAIHVMISRGTWNKNKEKLEMKDQKIGQGLSLADFYDINPVIALFVTQIPQSSQSQQPKPSTVQKQQGPAQQAKQSGGK